MNEHENSDSDNYFDSLSDSISSYDELEEELDELYDNDSEFIEQEKTNHNYYIGICKPSRAYDYYLLVNAVSPKLFYKTQYDLLIRYLQEYSVIYMSDPRIEIMKLYILQDETYTVSIKTYWIRLIQRHWKKIISTRKLIYKMRGAIRSLYYFELHGRYPDGLNTLPTLYGMLGCYSNHSTFDKFGQQSIIQWW
uniref:Uncharacterized protein n=1 Tax=viral metagenome TaxID=1070528 RepID=A0A6C0LT29_9ZZZZ